MNIGSDLNVFSITQLDWFRSRRNRGRLEQSEIADLINLDHPRRYHTSFYRIADSVGLV
jgi:hypothetical protein